jgi:hypothetical protein
MSDPAGVSFLEAFRNELANDGIVTTVEAIKASVKNVMTESNKSLLCQKYLEILTNTAETKDDVSVCHS